MSDIELRRIQRLLIESPFDTGILSQYYHALTRIFGQNWVNQCLFQAVRDALTQVEQEWTTIYFDRGMALTGDRLEFYLHFEPDALVIEVFKDMPRGNIDGEDIVADEIYSGDEAPDEIVETSIGNLEELDESIKNALRSQPWFCGFYDETLPPQPVIKVTSVRAEYGFMQPEVVWDTFLEIQTSTGDSEVYPVDASIFRNVVVEDIVTANPAMEITQEIINEHIFDEHFSDYSSPDELSEDLAEEYESLCDDADISRSLYDHDDVESLMIVDAYGARMSAPGYLDATEWAIFDTEDAANEYLREQHPPDQILTPLVLSFKLRVCKQLLDYAYEELLRWPQAQG